MGIDTIPDRVNGQKILTSHFNLLKRVLSINFVPRNSNGVTTDEGGTLGTDALRLLKIYSKEINIGENGSEKTIAESGNDIVFKFSSVIKGFVKTTLYQLSESSGNFSTTSTGDITNLNVTITTHGRPVFIGLIPDDSINNSYIGKTVEGAISILRDTTIISDQYINLTRIAPSAISMVDVVAAGTYTYKARVSVVAHPTAVKYCKLIAYEL